MEACSPWGGQGSRGPACRPQRVRDDPAPHGSAPPTLTATRAAVPISVLAAEAPLDQHNLPSVLAHQDPDLDRPAPLRLAPLLGRRPSPAGSSRRRRCGGHRRRGPCPRGRQRRPSRPSDQPRRLPSSAPAGLSQGCSLPGHLSPPRSAPCRDCQQQHIIKDRRIGHPPTAHDPSVLEHTTPSEPGVGMGATASPFHNTGVATVLYLPPDPGTYVKADCTQHAWSQPLCCRLDASRVIVPRVVDPSPHRIGNHALGREGPQDGGNIL